MLEVMRTAAAAEHDDLAQDELTAEQLLQENESLRAILGLAGAEQL